MDEDIIDDIADAFAEQMETLTIPYHKECYRAAIKDDIIALAIVINRHQPTYDLRYFYQRAGYPEPYPIHDMQY